MCVCVLYVCVCVCRGWVRVGGQGLEGVLVSASMI